jgi:hypothetical protein
MTSQVTRQLSVNITTTNTWTQLNDLATAAAYTVGAGARADVKWLRAINYGVNLATVEFAISVNNTITDNERIIPPVPLTTGESLFDDSGSVMAETWGLWARAVGTTPNVTFLAFVLEITP